VALIGIASNILVVNPALPVKTVAGLVTYGKANLGQLSYSTPDVGTPPHMLGEMFKQRTGLDITHLPYKGGGSSTQDVVSGLVSLTFENPPYHCPWCWSANSERSRSRAMHAIPAFRMCPL
jgi:tripartite-type tricarboxylate transporter receptor subunit TctC